MDRSDDDLPFEHHHEGLEHGYTPPDQRRRKPLHRKDLTPHFNETLYIQIGLGIAVFLLLAWFVFHIIQEKRRNEAVDQRSSLQIMPQGKVTATAGVIVGEFNV